MKYEEAKVTIRNMNFCGICTTGDHKNCDRYNAKCLALEALEKQIPVKPREDYDMMRCDDDDTDTTYWCSCGRRVGTKTQKDNYCSKCGQKLDWSDAE